MKFDIGNKYCIDDKNLVLFKLCDDSSLLYNNYLGDFSIYNISLGGNWRFQLIVDSNTGRCVKVESYLAGIVAGRSSISIARSERRELYFLTEEKMQMGSGCYYTPFSNEVCYDETKKILCYGEHNATGIAIEFAPRIIAIVNDGDLKCIYLLLHDNPKISAFLTNRCIEK